MGWWERSGDGPDDPAGEPDLIVGPVAADGGPDEELPQPPPGRRPAAAFVVGAVVLVAAVVLVIVSRTHRGEQASSPSSHRSSSGPVRPVVPTRLAGPDFRRTRPVDPGYVDPGLCHPPGACHLTRARPQRVVRAVGAVFPDLTLTACDTVVFRSHGLDAQVWQRRVRLASTSAFVTVTVGQPDGLPDSVTSTRSRGGVERLTVVHEASGPYSVTLTEQARVGYGVGNRRLVRLARDPDLRAVR